MSLKYIVLGMLREPHSGYDIGKQFEQSIGNFWRAELSQIYPLLKKLQSEGLLTSRAGVSDIGPTRRIYKCTAKGRRELESWLRAGPSVGTERIGYLAQTYFLANLNNDDKAVEFLSELREYMVEWLAQIEHAEKQWRESDARYPDKLPDDSFYPQLTLDFGLRKVRANIDWCDESIKRIRLRKQNES